MTSWWKFRALGLLLIVALALTACGGANAPAQTTQPTTMVEEHEQEGEHADEGEHEDEHAEDEHMDEESEGHMDEHSPEEHMEGAHDVPDEAAAVPNPIEATDESVSMGADLYADNCAVCHGENGEGDGPTAASLDPPPADLHEDHVQGLSDGGLFYIINHGRPDSAMPAWEGTLTEQEQWHIINFLRTFQE